MQPSAYWWCPRYCRVLQNFPPSLSSASQYTIPENTTIGTAIGILPFFDLDNHTQSYVFTSSRPDVAIVQFNAATLTATLVVNGTFNYNLFNQYVVVITVNDTYPARPLTATTTTTVVLTIVNTPPVFPNATVTASWMLHGGDAVGTPLVATIHNTASVLTFAIVSGNTTLFTVARVTGLLTTAQLYVNSSLPGQLAVSSTTFTLGVKATDPYGLSAVAWVTVNVVTLNYPPVVAPVNFTLFENCSVSGTVLGTVSYTDADGPQNQTYAIATGDDSSNPRFTIDNNGLLRVAYPVFSYVTSPLFRLTVQVTDHPSNPTYSLTGGAPVYVFVLHVNHPPSMPSSTLLSALEYAANRTVVGNVSAVDPDTACCGDVLTYTLAGPSPAFAVNATNGRTWQSWGWGGGSCVPM